MSDRVSQAIRLIESTIQFVKEHDGQKLWPRHQAELKRLDETGARLGLRCGWKNIPLGQSCFGCFMIPSTPSGNSAEPVESVHVHPNWMEEMDTLKWWIETGEVRPKVPDAGREEHRGQPEETGTGGAQVGAKLNIRQENVLEAMLEKGAVDRDNRTSRRVIVESINPKHKVPCYRRAFDGLLAAGDTKGEPGAEGGIWLTPAGRERAEQVKRRNDATRE